jgi:hypothetical protein
VRKERQNPELKFTFDQAFPSLRKSKDNKLAAAPTGPKKKIPAPTPSVPPRIAPPSVAFRIYLEKSIF